MFENELIVNSCILLYSIEIKFLFVIHLIYLFFCLFVYHISLIYFTYCILKCFQNFFLLFLIIRINQVEELTISFESNTSPVFCVFDWESIKIRDF